MNKKTTSLFMLFLSCHPALRAGGEDFSGDGKRELAPVAQAPVIPAVREQAPIVLVNCNSLDFNALLGQLSNQQANPDLLANQRAHVPVENQVQQANAQTAHNEAQQEQSQAQQQGQEQRQAQWSMQEMIGNLQSSAPSLDSLLDTLWRHKFLIAGTTCGYFIASLARARRAFRAPNAWSRWKRELSLEKLQAMPTETVSAALLAEIQKRYCNPTAPLDNRYPLVQFLRTINQEERWLNWYIRCGSIATRSWLGLLFWTSWSRVEQAKKQRKRLQFLREQFYLWAAVNRPPFSATSAPPARA